MERSNLLEAVTELGRVASKLHDLDLELVELTEELIATDDDEAFQLILARCKDVEARRARLDARLRDLQELLDTVRPSDLEPGER